MIYEMSWELLLCCPGHGGDNANHLYLYLWSVCGKLLVNDWKQGYSAEASAVLSHTGALCPKKLQPWVA